MPKTSSRSETAADTLGLAPALVRRADRVRALGFICLASALLLFCLWAIDRADSAPGPGFELDPACRIWYVQPGSPAERAGLAVGDRVRAVNGVPVSRLVDISPVTTRLKRGDPIRLQVHRNNGSLSVDLSAGQGPFPVWALVALIACAALLVQGAVLSFQRPGVFRFRLYLWMVLAAMLWSVSRLLILRFYYVPPPEGLVFLAGFSLSYLFIPLCTHFCFVLSGRKPALPVRGRGLLPLLYGPVLLFLVWNAAVTLLSWILYARGVPADFYAFRFETTGITEFLTGILAVYNGFLFLLSCFLLSRAYVLASSSAFRSQIKMCLLGILWVVLLGLLSTILYLVANAGETRYLPGLFRFSREIFLSLGVAGLLFMASLSLIRFHLTQVDYLIHQTVIHGTLRALFFLFYMAFVYAASLGLFQATADTHRLVLFAAVLLSAFLFQPLKHSFEHLLSHIFRKDEKRLASALERALVAGCSAPTPASLIQQTAEILVSEARTERCLFFVEASDGPDFVLAARREAAAEGEGSRETMDPVPAEVLTRLREPVSRFALEKQKHETDERLLDLFRERGLEILVPILHTGTCRGVMGLGGKRSRRMYTDEDLARLRVFSLRCGVNLHRAALVRELERLRGEMRESTRTASRQAEIIEEQKKETRELRRMLPAGTISSRRPVEHVQPPVEMIGQSAPFRKLQKEVLDVSGTDVPVLILGETGTGKDLVARAIHQSSPRSRARFVCINCSAIPEGLLESELFGHEKGAFTGAVEQKPGKFEVVNHGTLFLNEIGEMPLAMQAKLLRAIEHGAFERVGGTRTIEVDVRILAATNRDLEESVRQGGFREDLYYRLRVVPIAVPSLRERREDIPLLARHFLKKFSRKLSKEMAEDLDDESTAFLLSHAWPGNVRELENLIERAVVLSRDGRPLFPPFPKVGGREADEAFSTLNLQEALREHKRKIVLRALEESNGNKAKAARLLGIQYTNIFRLINQIGIK